MESRKFACLIAAGLIGVGLVGAATQAGAAPREGDVIVQGRAIDPDLQRTVFYGDLNLAFRTGQNVLARRINKTAWGLCTDLNPGMYVAGCTREAIRSTHDQVATAIDRAERKMAGLPTGPAIAISMVIGGR